jgi:hypothetical protein
MTQRVSPRLIAASLTLLALLAAHDLSHALDDGLDTKPGQLALISAPQWIVLAVITAVILRGDRVRGSLAALALGAGAALGFVVIHLLPFGPASYWDLDPSLASWVVAWVPTAVGAVVAAMAWSEWRAARRPAAAGTASPAAAA